MDGFINFFRPWRHIRPVWSVAHLPAANTKATITQAAPGVGARNVCTGITVGFAAGAAAPSAINVTVSLLDNVTAIWGITLSLPATAGAMAGVTRTDIWIPGTENQSMTLAFSVAGGANTVESVSMEGTTESTL